MLRAMRRRWAALLLVLLGSTSLGTSSHAQPADPFVAVRDADPMELARVVDRLGDDAVLTRLAGDSPRPVRLAAAHAAPFLREPELALAPLAELAAGRDPRLAPASAASLLTVARALDPDALARREVDVATLAPVRARLAALRDDASARRDLRVAAESADASLEALGVPR
jgi:hypothetical protein